MLPVRGRVRQRDGIRTVGLNSPGGSVEDERMIRMRSRYRSGILPALMVSASAMLSGQIVHPLAQPRYDQGPVEATFRLGYIQMMFQQTAAQRQGLDQLLAAQRDPSSPSYHNWLTPEQYADRFGVSMADLARVAAWLRSAGFTHGIHGSRAGLDRLQRHSRAG